MTEFGSRVYEIVRTIPEGQVMTYKDIAILLGNENLARAVGNALHRNPSNEETPCHRVVNSKGGLACRFGFGGREQQKILLEQEGVTVINYHVNLNN